MRANGSACLALVVEDDPVIRSEVVAEFMNRGWSVVEAGSGEAALDLLNEHRIDALFTDIQLAGVMLGWDVADAFRLGRPSSPVIYTSGNPAERSRCVEASLFVAKPYDSEKIVDAFECMLVLSDRDHASIKPAGGTFQSGE